MKEPSRRPGVNRSCTAGAGEWRPGVANGSKSLLSSAVSVGGSAVTRCRFAVGYAVVLPVAFSSGPSCVNGAAAVLSRWNAAARRLRGHGARFFFALRWTPWLRRHGVATMLSVEIIKTNAKTIQWPWTDSTKTNKLETFESSCFWRLSRKRAKTLAGGEFV